MQQDDRTMRAECRIRHGMTLRAHGTGGPSIFQWNIFPDDIMQLQSLASGGTNVTVKSSNGQTYTCPVEATKDEIEKLIETCRKLDLVCQHGGSVG